MLIWCERKILLLFASKIEQPKSRARALEDIVCSPFSTRRLPHFPVVAVLFLFVPQTESCRLTFHVQLQAGMVVALLSYARTIEGQ